MYDDIDFLFLKKQNLRMTAFIFARYSKWVNEWVSEWVSEWMNEWINIYMNERMNERTNDAIYIYV
jgi:hypothetical protein